MGATVGGPSVSPYSSQQLALVEDLSWYDPSSLDGFLDDIADVLSSTP